LQLVYGGLSNRAWCNAFNRRFYGLVPEVGFGLRGTRPGTIDGGCGGIRGGGGTYSVVKPSKK
jgi:hypothetical protein